MAVFAMTDCYVALNGSDRSAFIDAVTLATEANELETTNFTSAGWKAVAAGLKSGQIQLSFNQDVAAAAIDSIIWPLTPMGGGSGLVTYEIRATNAAVGTSNPKWTGTLFMREWSPLDGSVGDLAEVSVTWPTSGAVTRATS
jgi:hypothetical protein